MAGLVYLPKMHFDLNLERASVVPVPAVKDTRSKVTLWSLLYNGWTATNGPVLDSIGVVIALVAWHFGADVPVPFWVAATLCCLFVIVFFPIFHALHQAVGLLGLASAEVVSVLKPHPPYERSKAVCVIRFSETPPVGALMLFYRKEAHYERPVGSGSVKHHQADGSTQVTLDRSYANPQVEEFLKKLLGGEKEAVEALRVNATVTVEHLGGVIAETKAEALLDVGPEDSTTPTDS